MILAWLLLLTGLTISAVAIYYSVVGLAAIFSAAVIPIIVMGSALEVAKLVCASWLKANWNQAPRLMKIYMTTAVIVLMLITSMGIFGFLSKAHSDQSLVSGDVMAKISVYDEKIKTAKDNIDANRKALKQMDEAVDQVMGRSSDEKGADKAVAIRRGQQKERARLQAEIASEQKIISQLSEERAPIAAEVRKVEAEVGPLKYIAAFVYGETDETVLEKAVTWVIITIIIVFDPLAVIMLLAAQMTFGWKKEEESTPDPYVADVGEPPTDAEKKSINDFVPQPQEYISEEPKYEADDGPLTEEQLKQINALLAENAVVSDTVIPTPKMFVDAGEHPKDIFEHEKEEPVAEVKVEEAPAEPDTIETRSVSSTEDELAIDQWNKMIAEAEQQALIEAEAERYHPVEEPAPVNTQPDAGTVFPENPAIGQHFKRTDFDPIRDFVYNGSQWVDAERSPASVEELERPGDYLTETESKKKNYMTKDQLGHMQVKTRE